jgi:hypothetical protein
MMYIVTAREYLRITNLPQQDRFDRGTRVHIVKGFFEVIGLGIMSLAVQGCRES